MANDEITLKDFILKIQDWFSFLLSKGKVIAFGCVLGLVVGILYSQTKKPDYEAEVTFALEDEGSGMSGAFGLASQLGFDLGNSGGGAFAGDNLIELLKSRTLIAKALLTHVDINGVKLPLVEHYINFHALRKQWRSQNSSVRDIKFNRAANEFSLQQDSLMNLFYRNIIKENLSVNKIDKKLSIISVKVVSKNELFSKFLAETLVKEVADFYVETRTKKSIHNIHILQHQVDSVRRQLNSALSGVAVSSDFNPNPNLARQILRVPAQKRTIDVQANQVILTELVKNLEISKVTLRKETPLIQIIDSPKLPLKIEKPKTILIILLFFIASLVIVSFIVILKRYISTIMND